MALESMLKLFSSPESSACDNDQGHSRQCSSLRNEIHLVVFCRCGFACFPFDFFFLFPCTSVKKKKRNARGISTPEANTIFVILYAVSQTRLLKF